MSGDVVTIDLPRIHSGKVRELYDAGDERLLMVASDRVSAFDVIMAEPIRDKGRVLTAMTGFWCDEMADVVPGTLMAVDPERDRGRPAGASPLPPEWAGRAVLVRRAEMLQLECIVRGYLAGQAYEEYEQSGTVHGTPMPAGLQLAEPAWPSPSSPPRPRRPKGHDLNIDFAQAVDLVGAEAAGAARDICLELYAPRRGAGGRRPGSSWPTPSSSWATSTACSACATRCARPTPRGCGRPTRWCPAGRRRRSTSSRCATGWPRSPGIARRPRPRCPTR